MISGLRRGMRPRPVRRHWSAVMNSLIDAPARRSKSMLSSRMLRSGLKPVGLRL